MRNQPRDVTGGEAVCGGMIPGLGLMNYLLGLLTVPIEVFLRRDFGERYFTRMNFIGGLIILILWSLTGSLLNMINMFNPLAWLSNRSGSTTASAFPTVIKWYVLISIAHFLYMWWKDIIGNPVHSYSAGRSWLRPIGGAVMFLLNLVLNNIVRLIFLVTPGADKERLPSLLPVLRDKDTFTERFIEPFVVFIAALVFMGQQQYMVAWWLLFSVMALNMYTGLRHQAERGVFLDYRDQMIDARFYRMFLAGESTKGAVSGSKEKMVQETAREVEKNPDVLPIIEAQNPSLARAIERISPKLKAIAERENEAPGISQAV
ncbi:hypothetical protein ACO2Q8_29190 [Larkinella sp. VNQ87]|uniref:hypothetical protein n=1 Tax=Larkinella sp. VNQ87 TaxID=3400921 RepID=UPI003C0CBB91